MIEDIIDETIALEKKLASHVSDTEEALRVCIPQDRGFLSEELAATLRARAHLLRAIAEFKHLDV